MRIIDALNNRMPSIFDKTSPEYEAIFGKTEYAENSPIVDSADYNCGAVANELELLRAFIILASTNYDFDGLVGRLLEKAVFLFTGFTRIYTESDASLLKRAISILRRKGNLSWATSWCIQDVLSYFVPHDSLYIELFTDANLVVNYDFEDPLGAEWTLTSSGGAVVSLNTTEQFTRAACIEFAIDNAGDVGSLSQTVVNVTAGTAVFAIYAKDDGVVTGDLLTMQLQRASDSYYYNFEDRAWQAGMASKTVAAIGAEYGYISDWFVNEGTDDITLTIANVSKPGTAFSFYVDRVELGIKPAYPAIKILLVSQSLAGATNANMWSGTTDPTVTGDYANAAFLNQSFLFGDGGQASQSFFLEILDIIKPAGVKVELEVASRDA